MRFRFNRYVVDSDAFQLSADGIPVEIDPLAFDLLVYLIKHHQEVVTRDDLLNQLWKGKVVSESALSARIRDVRKAVGDSGKTQSVIRTVHGRGYQFVAELTTDTESSDVESSARELLEPELIPPRDTPSIAVLPFTDLAADKGQSYFAEGMTDEITTALSKIRNLMVIARLSTSGYTGSEIDPVQVGKEQGVGYVLMGTVNRQNDRIRVNVRLIDGHSGAYVWSESYDRDMTGLFDVQDEISREIAVALDVRLVGGEKVRKLSAGTRNIKAWKALRQGQYLAVDDVGPEVKKRGQELVEEALDHDPNYATAWVMLGWIYQQYSDVASLATDSAKNSNPTEQMLACAERALNADPECAEAYSLLAMYHLEMRSYDQALEAAEKSVAMAPNNAEVLSEASMVFNKNGNPERAIELKKRAMRLWPMYRPGLLRGLGLSYYLLGEYEKSIDLYRESVRRESDYMSAHTYLASMFGEQGRTDEAAAAVREILRLSPGFTISSYASGLSFRDAGVVERIKAGLKKAGLPE